MRLKLVSDFVDFYDHLFSSDEDSVPFSRVSASDIDQESQFEFLVSLKYNVPYYGQLGALLETMDNENDLFVIYDSKGQKPRFLTRSEALQEPFNQFSAAHILHDTGRAISYRWLQVGDHPFLLEYASDDSWNSRTGTVAIRVIKASSVRAFLPHIPHPLWAIDFIPFDNNSQRIAIKFTTSPVLQQTGIEEFMTAEEIVAAISRGVQNFVKKDR